jgi:hypothetical protein
MSQLGLIASKMSNASHSNEWLNRRPAIGQTCAFSHGYFDRSSSNEELISQWKRDALLFDRVYAKYTIDMPPPDIPVELSFGLENVENSIKSFDTSMAQMQAQAFAGYTQEEFLKEIGATSWKEDPLGFDNQLSSEYSSAGIMGEWTYASSGQYLRRFSEGEAIAYEGALSNIPIVSVSAAPWEQILDFRSDPEAVRKYRDLRLWLRAGLKADSIQHASDLIGQKIDDYRWSIKRHGLQTSLGALKTVFDWRDSKLTLTAMGLGAATGGPVWAAMAGGLSIAIQVGAWLTERRLDEKDVGRGLNREVAILYDVQEQFSGRSGAAPNGYQI